MTHELKFRYIYGIPGQPETYFARYFTIDQIENGTPSAKLSHFQHFRDKKTEIVSRDQFTGRKDKNQTDIYSNDRIKAWHEEYEEIQVGIVEYDWFTFKIKSEKQPKSAISRGYTEYLKYWKDGIHDWYSMEQFMESNVEVIGNIWNIDKPT